MLYLYNKANGSSKVFFKYSEMTCLHPETIAKTLYKLHGLGFIEIVQNSAKQKPFEINLKTTEEIQNILNKDKKIEKCQDLVLTKESLKNILGCEDIGVHFVLRQVPSWLRNINNNVWDRDKSIMLLKTASHLNCDYRIKSSIICKYAAKNASGDYFKNLNRMYKSMLPQKQEVLYNQLQNTLREKNLKHDGTFIGMVKTYLGTINKTSS
jgi:hypothetical protein